MYTFFGNTQKSFTWLRTSSSNLSIYWFRRRGAKWLLVLLCCASALFVYTDFTHFSAINSTQLAQSLCYTLWRVGDCVFFVTIQFSLFTVSLVGQLLSLLFSSLTRTTVSTQTKKLLTLPREEYMATVVPPRTLDLVYLNGLFTKTTNTGHSALTLTTPLRALYDLSLALNPQSKHIARTATFTTDTLPLPPKITTLGQVRLSGNIPFLLSNVLPLKLRTVLQETPVSVSVDSSALASSVFLRTGPLNLLNARLISARTARWAFLYSGRGLPDLSILNKIRTSLSDSLVGPLLGVGRLSTVGALPLQPIEWFVFRSQNLNRFCNEKVLINYAANPTQPQTDASTLISLLGNTSLISPYTHKTNLNSVDWISAYLFFLPARENILLFSLQPRLPVRTYPSQTTRWL